MFDIFLLRYKSRIILYHTEKKQILQLNVREENISSPIVLFPKYYTSIIELNKTFLPNKDVKIKYVQFFTYYFRIQLYMKLSLMRGLMYWSNWNDFTKFIWMITFKNICYFFKIKIFSYSIVQITVFVKCVL